MRISKQRSLEACKNVSCHGFDGYSDKYELKCSVEKGKIEIVVKDACSDTACRSWRSPARIARRKGDLGIFVIQSLMNEVVFGKEEDGRKSIKMVKVL